MLFLLEPPTIDAFVTYPEGETVTLTITVPEPGHFFVGKNSNE